MGISIQVLTLNLIKPRQLQGVGQEPGGCPVRVRYCVEPGKSDAGIRHVRGIILSAALSVTGIIPRGLVA